MFGARWGLSQGQGVEQDPSYDSDPHVTHTNMANHPKRLVAVTFIIAAVLSAVAAILPMVRGRPLNAAFFGAALLFLVVGVVRLRASGKPGDGHAP